eukprot:CFRG0621T1
MMSAGSAGNKARLMVGDAWRSMKLIRATLPRVASRKYQHSVRRAIRDNGRNLCFRTVPKRHLSYRRIPSNGRQWSASEVIIRGALFGVGVSVAVVMFPYVLGALGYFFLFVLIGGALHFAFFHKNYRQAWRMSRQIKDIIEQTDPAKYNNGQSSPFRSNIYGSKSGCDNPALRFAEAVMGTQLGSMENVKRTYEMACNAVRNDDKVRRALRLTKLTFSSPTEVKEITVNGETTITMKFRVELSNTEVTAKATSNSGSDIVLKSMSIRDIRSGEKYFVDVEGRSFRQTGNSDSVIKDATFRDL